MLVNTGILFSPQDQQDSADTSSAPGCWEMTLSGDADSGYTAEFENRYYSVGGRTYEAPAQKLSGLAGTEIIALKLSSDPDSSLPAAELTTYASMSELMEDQDDEYSYVIPLYRLENGAVACDFRLGVAASMWEFSAP